MAPYLGDFVEDATVHHIWDSFDSSGASITRSTNGTIRVYKNNGTAQSVAGVTDTEDFDSLTGIHVLTIDTNANVFYVAGANYTVVLSGATIDGQSVNRVLCHFSIENRSTVAIKTDTAAIAVQVAGAGVSAEPNSPPAASATLAQKIAWLFSLSRNKATQTGSTKTLRNDADSANIGTSAITDDDTTFTRAEWV